MRADLTRSISIGAPATRMGMHRFGKASLEPEPPLPPESKITQGFVPKRYLKVRFARCPVGLSLGILGRKWALLIMRDLAAYGADRFNLLLKSVPGISPKVLSIQLHELEKGGFIQRIEESRSPARVRWGLTERGFDLLPVLMMVTAYQSKWNPQLIHPDGKTLRLRDIFDDEAMTLIERML
jgi:DNA-binding HxlR family transcriptional regulator